MRNAARSLAASLLAGLWLLQEASVASAGWLPVVQPALALLVVFFGVGFVIARTLVSVVAAMALAVAGGLAFHFSMYGSLVNGAGTAVLFVAFLASMQMLKVSIDLRPGLESLRREHEALAPREQHDVMLLRSFLAGSIFAAGTMTLLAPLVGPQRPQSERRALAQSALQGVGLALLWSPFFVAMAVCLKLSTGITLPGALASGLVLSLMGLAISHLAFGGRLKLALLKPAARIFAASAAMALTVVVLNRTLGLSNSEAIVAVIPLVAAAMAWRSLRSSPRTVARRWHDALEAIAPEALLVSASLVLGEVIKDLLAEGVVGMPASVLSWPEPFIIAWPALGMAALSTAGLHPIIGASLFFPLQSSLPMLHPVVAAGSVMLGWMLAMLLSTLGVPVMFAAAMFRVPARDLVLGATLRFALIFCPFAWLYLWLLNQFLRG